MRFIIKHETRGRIRLHLDQKHMTYQEADTLAYVLEQTAGVSGVKVYDRTCDVVINYKGSRETLLHVCRQFRYETAEVPDYALENTGRELNNTYQEKLIGRIAWHYGKRILLPLPVRTVLTAARSISYIKEGIRCLLQRKLEVPVLDGTAIAVSMLTGDFSTASSIMFLLGVGELLEEWTHKKSVGDLARSMSLNVGKVWVLTEDGQEVLLPTDQVKPGDHVRIHMGNVIPFDGIVIKGEASVNQASLTGESVPVDKYAGASVFAGTVMEEGELTVEVKASSGSNRYDKIVTMIEDSEKLKSALESRAEHLADGLVPWTLGGTALTYLLTRNVTKAMSILMVDFCCALKLAMPISVLTAIRQAGRKHITVKGGKSMEAIAEADTIVFDKTGTLTEARPTVAQIIVFDPDKSEDELLRIAACVEEHFPHSVAKAVTDEAVRRHLEHEEMHSKVEYIVAHGIATTIEGRRMVIGSYHFVMEDEGCRVPDYADASLDALPMHYSHLYMAIDGTLEAVICIEDPLRKEAPAVMKALRRAGISKLVMMTGDSQRTAAAIAAQVGVDEYYAEVLPEDKAGFVEKEKAAGRKVIMIGDGINDSPALSAADVGIAISDGAELAREIADITIGENGLQELVTLHTLSRSLMQRIGHNYRMIVGFNSGLIALGILGILPPTTTALLHNTSTLMIGLQSMTDMQE